MTIKGAGGHPTPLTVAMLIAQLQELPPELPVYTHLQDTLIELIAPRRPAMAREHPTPMTVSMLIAQLQELPPGMPMYTYGQGALVELTDWDIRRDTDDTEDPPDKVVIS